MTNSDTRLKRFPTMAELAQALAADVAQTLARAIDARGGASLVVSGGKTPVKLFEQLARTADRMEPGLHRARR